MNKLLIILRSRFQKETGEEYIKKRREVCKTCEYNSLNSPRQIFKHKLYKNLSNFYTWLTRSENIDLGFCECECPIYEKTRQRESECYAKEEYGEDKWQSIYIPNKK